MSKVPIITSVKVTKVLLESEVFIRVEADDWYDDKCPADVVNKVDMSRSGQYIVTVDEEKYPCPAGTVLAVNRDTVFKLLASSEITEEVWNYLEKWHKLENRMGPGLRFCDSIR
jgi:hypothetical protein